MIDRKNPSESGNSDRFALAVAFVICAAAVGAALLLAPASATSEVSDSSAYGGPNGYFPDQYVNQAKEIEPMPEIYY